MRIRGSRIEEEYTMKVKITLHGCGNIEFIQNLKEEAFARFVKKKVIEVCEKNDYYYEPEFKKIENI